MATLRYDVHESHAGLGLLTEELETALASAQDSIGEEEFLQLLSRCLKLRKQAMVACLQAVQRANPTTPGKK